MRLKLTDGETKLQLVNLKYPCWALSNITSQSTFVYRFYHSSITDWAEINWAKLSRKAADVGGCFLHKTYKDMIRNNVPPKHHKNFEGKISHQIKVIFCLNFFFLCPNFSF